MKILRVTTKEKPVLNYLEDAWIAPDDQDVLTSDIVKWLRKNIHRRDVGLWVIINKGAIVGAMIAMGPSLLLQSVHIYCAWVKPGEPVNAKSFFEHEFITWVRSLGCNEITICSNAHSARAWERAYGFKSYTRMYRRSLEPIDLELDEQFADIEELEHGR